MSVYSRLIAVLCLVLVTSCCTRARISMPRREPAFVLQTEGQPDFAEGLLRSLLAIRISSGETIIGSGVLLSLDGIPYVMTAHHVVSHFMSSKGPVDDVVCYIEAYTGLEDCVDLQLGGNYDQLVTSDASSDLALIPLERFPERSRSVDTVVPDYEFRIGEEVWLVGCPLGNPNIATKGIVSGFVRNDSPRLFTDGDAWFGTSGGGVFLPTGEYVGLVQSMVGSRTGTGAEIAEGLNVFSPLPLGWGLD